MRGEKLYLNKQIKLKKNIHEYIKPQIIYVPLENKNGVTYEHLVKQGDYVYKGDVVAINKNINFPLHSSVSGYAITGTKKIMNNGKKIKCVVIENDFKEKYRDKIGAKRKINNYTKEEFITLLRKSGITGLGGSDFPTFLKYNSDKEINYLLINGVECEPYIDCDKAVMNNFAEELLECVDSILEIMKIKKAYFVIKENNFKTAEILKQYIGTYPNIELSLVPDFYPAGWERNVVSSVLNKEYKNYPIEIGVIVSNVSTIYAIYEMLKYNRPLTERIITITGTGIRKPTNVKVKIGALLSEIIENIEGYKEIKNPLFIAGGPMMGKSLPSDELVVTKDLNCVLVIENNEEKQYPCIKCGKCSMVCPVKLSPVLIMKNYDNVNKLKNLKPEKCIECGLCSYTCPSKIEVREYVKIAKEKVKNK